MIPAIIREMDDSAVAAVTLIENIQREDLNPLEEARALQRLKDEFKMTHQSVADAVGRSRAAVTNLMRLLELDERVANMLAEGKLEMGHARALLSLDPSDQHMLAMKVYAEGLSVRPPKRSSGRAYMARLLRRKKSAQQILDTTATLKRSKPSCQTNWVHVSISTMVQTAKAV